MDTTLGLAQHYCEMHDYISKYIYSDIGYDCQVLFEEGFWEKIGSSIKTAANNVWKFLVKIWNDVINFIQNFFHKSRKVLNELANNTRKYISEIIAFIQKVIREKSTDTNGKANGINKVSKYANYIISTPKHIKELKPEEVDFKAMQKSIIAWKSTDAYIKLPSEKDKTDAEKDKTESMAKTIKTSFTSCLPLIIGSCILRVDASKKPSLIDLLKTISLDNDILNIDELTKKKVNDCCEAFDTIKDFYETYCFPNDAGFYSTIGTLNDLSAKYAHYINETYGLFNKCLSKIKEKTSRATTISSDWSKEIQEILLSTEKDQVAGKYLDDTKTLTSQMFKDIFDAGSKNSTSIMLKNVCVTLNEVMSNLITKLKEIDKHRKDKNSDNSEKYPNLSTIDWSLDTKYKPDEIERKGEAEIIKFANEDITFQGSNNIIVKQLATFKLDNIQSNLLFTVSLTNILRMYFVGTHEMIKKFYEDEFKKEKDEILKKDED